MGITITTIILIIVYFILAGVCWKCYKEDTTEDNCLFGAMVFAMIGIFLIIKFLIF